MSAELRYLEDYIGDEFHGAISRTAGGKYGWIVPSPCWEMEPLLMDNLDIFFHKQYVDPELLCDDGYLYGNYGDLEVKFGLAKNPRNSDLIMAVGVTLADGGNDSFLSSSSYSGVSQPSNGNTSYRSPLEVEVYVDGSCLGNGKPDAVGGIGVFWDDDSPFNVSEAFRLPGVATSIRAEIHASVRAINIAKHKIGASKVTVITDSKFFVDSIELWLQKWLDNGWVRADGRPVVNRADFEDYLDAENGIEVKLEHVPGHQGVYGNEQAHDRALRAARSQLRRRN